MRNAIEWNHLNCNIIALKILASLRIAPCSITLTLSMQSSDYGCTREVAKHEQSVTLASYVLRELPKSTKTI